MRTKQVLALQVRGPGSNGNERVLQTTQVFRTGTSPSDLVSCFTHIFFGKRKSYPSSEDAITIF